MPNIHSNISFALVNIPVTLTPIIKNNDTTFNQLHKKCENRIKYLKYCPHCQKNVKENEIIKGYQYEKEKYITFEKEELNKLKLSNEKEIEIISFISLDEIDPIYYEKSYLLKADNKPKSYYLFCEALKKTKKVALAKTIISTKFYYCLLRLTKYGIILTTLYFAEEIKLDEKYATSKSNTKELDLAIKIINTLQGKFEPEKYQDEYQKRIKDAIKAKLKGQKIKTPKSQTVKINNLLEALEKSLKAQK